MRSKPVDAQGRGEGLDVGGRGVQAGQVAQQPHRAGAVGQAAGLEHDADPGPVLGGDCHGSSPSTRTAPPSGRCSPTAHSIAVVLPAPLGPSRAVTLAGARAPGHAVQRHHVAEAATEAVEGDGGEGELHRTSLGRRAGRLLRAHPLRGDDPRPVTGSRLGQPCYRGSRIYVTLVWCLWERVRSRWRWTTSSRPTTSSGARASGSSPRSPSTARCRRPRSAAWSG